MAIDEARRSLAEAAHAFVQDPQNLRKLCEAASAYHQARIAAASGETALKAAQQTPGLKKGTPKPSKCKRCGAGIVWGVFGSGKFAPIDPASLAVGYEETPEGKVHFKKTLGHRLHDCPNRAEAK